MKRIKKKKIIGAKIMEKKKGIRKKMAVRAKIKMVKAAKMRAAKAASLEMKQ